MTHMQQKGFLMSKMQP